MATLPLTEDYINTVSDLEKKVFNQQALDDLSSRELPFHEAMVNQLGPVYTDSVLQPYILQARRVAFRCWEIPGVRENMSRWINEDQLKESLKMPLNDPAAYIFLQRIMYRLAGESLIGNVNNRPLNDGGALNLIYWGLNNSEGYLRYRDQLGADKNMFQWRNFYYAREMSLQRVVNTGLFVKGRKPGQTPEHVIIPFSQEEGKAFNDFVGNNNRTSQEIR